MRLPSGQKELFRSDPWSPVTSSLIPPFWKTTQWRNGVYVTIPLHLLFLPILFLVIYFNICLLSTKLAKFLIATLFTSEENLYFKNGVIQQQSKLLDAFDYIRKHVCWNSPKPVCMWAWTITDGTKFIHLAKDCVLQETVSNKNNLQVKLTAHHLMEKPCLERREGKYVS